MSTVNGLFQLDQITNHIQLGVSRLLEEYQFQLKTTAHPGIPTTLDDNPLTGYKVNLVKRLITALYLKQIQYLEDVAFTLLSRLNIDVMTGVNLDGIGQLVNQTRNGLDDATYRIMLKGKIVANNSNGTTEDIIATYKAMVPLATEVTVREGWPASIEVAANSPPLPGTSAIVKQNMKLATSAGIGTTFAIIFDPTNAFTFDANPVPPITPTIDPLKGFSNLAQTTGGKFAYLFA